MATITGKTGLLEFINMAMAMMVDTEQDEVTTKVTCVRHDGVRIPVTVTVSVPDVLEVHGRAPTGALQ